MVVISITSTEPPLPNTSPLNRTFLKSTCPRISWSTWEHANTHPTPLVPEPRSPQAELAPKQVTLTQAAGGTLAVPGQGPPPGGREGPQAILHLYAFQKLLAVMERAGWEGEASLHLLPSPGSVP